MAEQLPTWLEPGVEPPEVLKTNGWQPGMKPSAQHMNWLLNRIYKCIEEIQAGGGTEELKQELADLQQEFATLQQELTTHTAEDASLTKKGHVQLSNATNSTSETTAPTSKALAVTYEGLSGLMDGKYSSKKVGGKTADKVPLTTEKSDLIGMINEAFLSASDGKTLVANATSAKGVPASPADTFLTLATKIGQISTGKKFASGTSLTDYTGGNYRFTVAGLTFLPKLILASQTVKIGDSSTTKFTLYVDFAEISTSGTRKRYNGSWYALAGDEYVNSSGFRLDAPLATASNTIYWIALGD